MLLTLPELLNADELQHTRALLAHAPWRDGRDSAGPQAARVKNNQQLPQDSEAAHEIRALVLRALDRSAAFFSAALPKKIVPPRVNRYGGQTDAYGPHIDNAIRALASGGRVRTDLSCTLFLSEPESYDGGELCIADSLAPFDAASGAAPAERCFKLPAGHLLLYPGTHLHQVRPVTRGQRLACFFWIESMVRSDEQRRLLYELDMNLLRLRQQHGESPETTALTGTYHNLLRLWSDT